MLKEPYGKPEVKSEILEPEALCCTGSSGFTNHPMIQEIKNPSCGICCED